MTLFNWVFISLQVNQKIVGGAGDETSFCMLTLLSNQEMLFSLAS